MSDPSERRAISDEEVETFWRDGVVCLRGALDPALLAAMETPIDHLLDTPEMADLSTMGDALATAGEVVLVDDDSPRLPRGRFVSGVDHWRAHAAFRGFACASSLPSIAGALLRATTINLWEDSVLVKEPGTVERTAWHQDLAYFHATGEQICTTWCPADRVDADSGAVLFARGSHRWPDVFRPNFFVSKLAIPGSVGEPVPDIDEMASAGTVELLQFDMVPGDITVHHARTVHGAGANRTPSRRRAISVRYCGDDVRFLTRAGAPLKAHHRTLRDGDPLDADACPVVWHATR